jgi:hypothetical protein
MLQKKNARWTKISQTNLAEKIDVGARYKQTSKQYTQLHEVNNQNREEFQQKKTKI